MEEQYHPEWDAYLCLVNEKPASIAIDLDLRRFAPLEDRIHLIHISIQVLEPDENGLPKGHELEKLSEIEDNLACELGDKLDAVFAGRIAHDGLRSFYFYAATTADAAAVVIDSISEFEGYSAQLEISEEPEWETYFDFLLPDEREFQRIQNRRLLAQLEEYGDKPDRPRRIEHWVYFPTEENRADFVRSVVSQGYQCDNMAAEKENPLDFKLLVSREDTTTEENIDEVVLYLWETAQEFEGEYDGWETTVVRE
jgi:uncharacterized protein (TIGR01619 family)